MFLSRVNRINRYCSPPTGHRPVARAKGARSDRGLTLIEILVAILIVAGLMALVVPSIRSVTGVRAREEASRMAGAIRYLYNHTAVTGRTCRIVFSMGEEDGDNWMVECTEDAPRLEPEELKVNRGVIDRGFEEDDWFRRGTRDEDSIEHRIRERARWNQFASRTVQPSRLPSGVSFGGVWTSSFSDVVTEQDAYLYFFPAGETQRAVIYIVDSWDNAYTLDVQPLTGRVRVTSGWEEVPRE